MLGWARRVQMKWKIFSVTWLSCLISSPNTYWIITVFFSQQEAIIRLQNQSCKKKLYMLGEQNDKLFSSFNQQIKTLRKHIIQILGLNPTQVAYLSAEIFYPNFAFHLCSKLYVNLWRFFMRYLLLTFIAILTLF